MSRLMLCLVLSVLATPVLAGTPGHPHGGNLRVGPDLLETLEAQQAAANAPPRPSVLAALPVAGPLAVKLDKVLQAHPRPADHAKPVYTAAMATGQGYAVAALDARGEMPLHTHHARTEVLYITAGTGLFRLAGMTYKAVPGAVFVVPADTPHGFSVPKKLLGLVVSIGAVDPADTLPVPAAEAK